MAGGLAIAVVMVASRALSQRSGVPYAVFLVVAGAAVSFIPGVQVPQLGPRVVFLGFLPPLVYHAGAATSPRELRAHAVPIGLSAFGLVLATTFAVAGATWAAVPSLGWATAFVLGAVVAPTDAVASVSVLRRLGGPPGLTTILEGESLVNDGVALALFSVGTLALSAPTGVGGGLAEFLKVAAGGTGLGLGLGWLAAQARRPLRDPASQIVVSLLVPFAAYLPADALGLSGVLATLAAGLVLGQQTVAGLAPSGRLRVAEFWDVLVFLLESALFVLVGLQLRHIAQGVAGYPSAQVALAAALAVVVVVVVRLAWWWAVPTLRWRPRRGVLLGTGAVPWQERAVLGWSGLRGAISLAAALSVPSAGARQGPVGRDLVIFATFCVIVVTLVGQGTSLPWLLRRLSLARADVALHQQALARRRCAEAALSLLDELLARREVADDVAGAARQLYERRLEAAGEQLLGPGGPSRDRASLAAVLRQLLAAQQGALQELYRRGDINFAVLRALRRELDMEHASLEGPW